MHTALISLVLMCGACGDTSDQTPSAIAQPAVVSRELPAGHTATMNLRKSETVKLNCGWQQR